MFVVATAGLLLVQQVIARFTRSRVSTPAMEAA
jgi:hypothetical protein